MAKNVIAFCFVSALLYLQRNGFIFSHFAKKMEAPYLLFADYISNDCLTVV